MNKRKGVTQQKVALIVAMCLKRKSLSDVCTAVDRDKAWVVMAAKDYLHESRGRAPKELVRRIALWNGMT